MVRIFFTTLLISLVSFKNESNEVVKYIYIPEYNAYIRVFDCSKLISKEIEMGKKLMITPKKGCNDFYVKCMSNNKGGKILEEGLYRCDTTTKNVNIESRNDNGSTYFVRKYFIAKRVGNWIFNKDKKTTKQYK